MAPRRSALWGGRGSDSCQPCFSAAGCVLLSLLSRFSPALLRLMVVLSLSSFSTQTAHSWVHEEEGRQLRCCSGRCPRCIGALCCFCYTRLMGLRPRRQDVLCEVLIKRDALQWRQIALGQPPPFLFLYQLIPPSFSISEGMNELV